MRKGLKICLPGLFVMLFSAYQRLFSGKKKADLSSPSFYDAIYLYMGSHDFSVLLSDDINTFTMEQSKKRGKRDKKKRSNPALSIFWVAMIISHRCVDFLEKLAGQSFQTIRNLHSCFNFKTTKKQEKEWVRRQGRKQPFCGLALLYFSLFNKTFKIQ